MPDFIQVPSDGAGKKSTTKVFNDGSSDFHTPVVHVGDRTDPDIQQTVKRDGAALVDFPTGSPVFNSFNRLLTAEDELLSAFKFYEGPKAVAGKIDDTVVAGAGTVAFDATNLSYRCRVPSGAGNSAQLSSHRRFSYKPGSSVTMYFVVSTNNPTQPNQVMRAGLFDEDDGIFFEIENGVINCVIRSSVSGSVVEEKIPQSTWNGDRMDGLGGDTNRSGQALDPTKLQIFAITYQYLSAGAVTFSHYVDGVPVVLHTIGHHNDLTAPYMGTTYLPHRFEIENTGAGQVGDTDLYTFCSATLGQGYTDLIRTPLGFDISASLTDGNETYVGAFRPAQTYLGEDNRYRYLLQYLSSFSSAAPVKLTLYASADVAGATWAQQILGLEIDSAGSLVSGHPYGKKIVGGADVGEINLMQSGSDSSTDGLFRNNDITASDVWVITAQSLTGVATDVYVSGAFFEVQ